MKRLNRRTRRELGSRVNGDAEAEDKLRLLLLSAARNDSMIDIAYLHLAFTKYQRIIEKASKSRENYSG